VINFRIRQFSINDAFILSLFTIIFNQKTLKGLFLQLTPSYLPNLKLWTTSVPLWLLPVWFWNCGVISS